MEELTRSITIGQYLPTGSPIHRMDPRVKLMAFILLVVAASVTGSLIGDLCTLVVTLAALRAARIPLLYGLRGLRPAWPLLVVMLIVQSLFYAPEAHQTVWWRWGWMAMSPAGLHLTFVSLLKFVVILLLVSAFTLSTTLSEIAHGVEQLLRPLARIRFPAHEVALIVVITLRFVPTFAAEAERLVKAQAARGASIASAGRWQIIRTARAFLPLLVPLFVGALRKGEQLAVAMEARGYVPGLPRTSYVSSRATARDWLAVLACLVYCVLMAIVPFPT